MNFTLVLACIAAIETGCPVDHGNQIWSKYDRKVGKHGEITRYQILPSVSKEVIGRKPKSIYEANTLAWHVILARHTCYLRKYKKLPRPEIVYALWNSPAYTLRTGKVPYHCKEKAERFANLYYQELINWKH